MNDIEMYAVIRKEGTSVPEDENNEGDAGLAGKNYYDGLARALLYALGFILPFWALPITELPVEINKTYLAYFLTLSAFILYLAGRIREGEIILPKSGFIFGTVALTVVWGISALLSVDRRMSLIGAGYEGGTFLALAIAALAVFLFSVLFQDAERVRRWLLFFTVSAGVVFACQAWHFLGWPAAGFSKEIFNSSTANLIGDWNSFGVFAGLVLLFSLLLAELALPFYARIGLKLLALAAAFFIAVVNFTMLWWVLAAFLIALLSLFYVARRDLRTSAITIALFAVLFTALFFIITPPFIGEWLPNKLDITFIEARPSWESTGAIVSKVLKEDPFFGSGPNTFLYDWLRLRPQSLNTTLFWGVRFQSGVGHFPSFAATTGIFGLLALFWALGAFLYRGAKITFSAVGSRREEEYLLFVLFTGATYLWTMNLLYTPGYLLLFYAFIFSALFTALLVAQGDLRNLRFRLFGRSAFGFVSVMATIFILLFSMSVFYNLAGKYFAAYSYGKGVKAAVAGDIEEGRRLVERATQFNEESVYYRILTDLDLAEIQKILSEQDVPADKLRADFQAALTRAINDGQQAVRLGRPDPANWRSLGKVYEAVVPFKVSGAAQVANDTYEEARKRDPQNPEIALAMARVAVASDDLVKAKEFLDKAIALKSDYAPARFLAVQVESQLGNTKEAIMQGEAARLLAPNDVGILFQLGLLYYRNGNLASARQTLESAVALNPGYSNARYFLGLIYAQEERIQDALLQFEVILTLNPGNAEVLQIIENLRAGKSALATIAPPGPLPERRLELPVE